jgi:uncharacterized membrane protein
LATSGGANGTNVFGINNAGQIVGDYSDATGVHGFLRTPGTAGAPAVFTTLDDPLATRNQTSAFGINDAGQIVGRYVDDNGSHGFLLSGGTYFTLDDPLATPGLITSTIARGINASGQIVGVYNDGTRTTPNVHGFLMVTAPNPPPPAGTTGT